MAQYLENKYRVGDRIMATYIVDKDNVTSVEASGVTKPSDRHFRNAWILNSDKDVIIENMAAAKILMRDKIRDARSGLLAALDVEYMKALEAGNSSAQAEAKNKKQALRDAPAASDIADARTISQLKAAWPTSILGSSPF